MKLEVGKIGYFIIIKLIYGGGGKVWCYDYWLNKLIILLIFIGFEVK